MGTIIAYLDIDPDIVKQWVSENRCTEADTVKHFLQECCVGDYQSENFVYNPSDGSIYQTHDTDFPGATHIRTALDALSIAYDDHDSDSASSQIRLAQWLQSMAGSCKRFEWHARLHACK
jgi:hypothetical protein